MNTYKLSLLYLEYFKLQMTEIFEKLPWELKRTVIEFNAPKNIHEEFMFYLSIGYKHLASIRDRKFRKFYYDCMIFAPDDNSDFYDNDWTAWILYKVYNGEKPWIYFDEDMEKVRIRGIWLRLCSKKREQYTTYGISLKYLLIKLLI